MDYFSDATMYGIDIVDVINKNIHVESISKEFKQDNYKDIKDLVVDNITYNNITLTPASTLVFNNLVPVNFLLIYFVLQLKK